jgi:hypothetical protein
MVKLLDQNFLTSLSLYCNYLIIFWNRRCFFLLLIKLIFLWKNFLRDLFYILFYLCFFDNSGEIWLSFISYIVFYVVLYFFIKAKLAQFLFVIWKRHFISCLLRRFTVRAVLSLLFVSLYFFLFIFDCNRFIIFL